MPYVWLAGAILSEVAATTSLKYVAGFTRPLPGAVTVLGYLASFYLLSLALRRIQVSVAYAIWSAIGTALIALIGAAFLDEPLTAVKLLGLLLIVAGVVALNLGGAG